MPAGIAQPADRGSVVWLRSGSKWAPRAPLTGTAESVVSVKLVAVELSSAWLRAVTGLAPFGSVGVASV